MTNLAADLEKDHHDIDRDLEAFIDRPEEGGPLTSLRKAMDDLRRHIYLEEVFLFPPLRSAGFIGPVLVMLKEHGQMWDVLARVEGLLGDGRYPDAAETLKTELFPLLQAHNPKEEQILYPQLDGVLGAAAAAELREFLAQGVVPDGWTCERAGRSQGPTGGMS